MGVNLLGKIHTSNFFTETYTYSLHILMRAFVEEKYIKSFVLLQQSFYVFNVFLFVFF